MYVTACMHLSSSTLLSLDCSPYTLLFILRIFISKKSRVREELEACCQSVSISSTQPLVIVALPPPPTYHVNQSASSLIIIRKITQNLCPNSSFSSVFTQLQIEEAHIFLIIFIWKGHLFGLEGQIAWWCCSQWLKKDQDTDFKRKCKIWPAEKQLLDNHEGRVRTS